MLECHHHFIMDGWHHAQPAVGSRPGTDDARPIALRIIRHPREFDLDAPPAVGVVRIGDDSWRQTAPLLTRPWVVPQLLAQQSRARAAHGEMGMQTCVRIGMDGTRHQIVAAETLAQPFNLDHAPGLNVRPAEGHAIGFNK